MAKKMDTESLFTLGTASSLTIHAEQFILHQEKGLQICDVRIHHGNIEMSSVTKDIQYVSQVSYFSAAAA